MIRVLLADDHQMVRAGLRSLLEQHGGIEVVGEADDGRQAITLVERLLPDVLIIDVSMPGLNGIDAIPRIKRKDGKIRVIVLSMHAEQQFIAAALKAGASGYLLKTSAPAELVTAIESICRGSTYLSPEVAGAMVNQFLRPSVSPMDPGSLTAREREVLQLLSEGRSNKQIAATLEIGPKTVETHRSQIMQKLNLRSVAELTKYAIRHGLTSLDG